jgi:lysophospholipid acyltransferase (LPLAT)-like uncharacterized protein
MAAKRQVIGGILRFWVLTALCFSWRKRFIGLERLDRQMAAGEKMIVVFWHGKYFALLPLLRNRNACVFTSLSARGDMIRDLLERLGYHSVQLKDHGRQDSLNRMRVALQHAQVAAMAVDGPLGPQHRVHHGAVELASEYGHRVVPISVAAWPKRTLTSRWDHFEIPYPFSRVCLVVGEPLTVPPQLSGRDIHHWQNAVHDSLEQLGIQAEQCALDKG